jgi:hypothetical protein
MLSFSLVMVKARYCSEGVQKRSRSFFQILNFQKYRHIILLPFFPHKGRQQKLRPSKSVDQGDHDGCGGHNGAFWFSFLD